MTDQLNTVIASWTAQAYRMKREGYPDDAPLLVTRDEWKVMAASDNAVYVNIHGQPASKFHGRAIKIIAA